MHRVMWDTSMYPNLNILHIHKNEVPEFCMHHKAFLSQLSNLWPEVQQAWPQEPVLLPFLQRH